MRRHDRPRKQAHAHAGGLARCAVHPDPLHAAARRAALEDVPAKRVHSRHRVTGDLEQRVGDVDRGVGDPYRPGRIGIAGETDGRARNAESRQRLGTPGDILEIASERARDKGVALVSPVMANGIAEQAAAHADRYAPGHIGTAGGRVAGAHRGEHGRCGCAAAAIHSDRRAMKSISIRASRASAVTPMQVRAGRRSRGKYDT